MGTIWKGAFSRKKLLRHSSVIVVTAILLSWSKLHNGLPIAFPIAEMTALSVLYSCLFFLPDISEDIRKHGDEVMIPLEKVSRWLMAFSVFGMILVIVSRAL